MSGPKQPIFYSRQKKKKKEKKEKMIGLTQKYQSLVLAGQSFGSMIKTFPIIVNYSVSVR